jgi:hypothetical protein
LVEIDIVRFAALQARFNFMPNGFFTEVTARITLSRHPRRVSSEMRSERPRPWACAVMKLPPASSEA